MTHWRGVHSRTLQAAVLVVSGAALTILGITSVVVSQGTGNGVEQASMAVPVANTAAVEEHYHPGRPAHIHDGSCSNLGEVEFPLNPVGAGTMTGPGMEGVTSMPLGVQVGSPLATPMEVGRISLDVPLSEIVAGERALNVQISEFDYGNYIACGNVPSVRGLDTLAFGLAERNGSGFAGMAILQANGAMTDVAVYLAPGLGSVRSQETTT